MLRCSGGEAVKIGNDFFERMEDDFDVVAYCPKKDEIFLIAEKYVLLDNMKWYYRYADKDIYGKDILVSRTKTWFYVGEVKNE